MLRRIALIITSGVSTALLLDVSAKGQEVNIRLINGDLISGKIVHEESNNLVKVIDNKYLGKIKIKKSTIAKSKREKAWKSNLEIGLDGSNSGSSSSSGYNIEGATKYKKKSNQIKIRGDYEVKRTKKNNNSLTGVRKGSSSIRYDRIQGPLWTTYTSTEYKYNALNKSGINTIITSLGMSYKIHENPKTSLTLSVGPSAKWFNGGKECQQDANCEKILGAGSFGAEFIWSINDKTKFIIENNLITAFAENLSPSNHFLSKLKFYPKKNSNIFSSINLEHTYDYHQDPKVETSYNLQVGTDF